MRPLLGDDGSHRGYGERGYVHAPYENDHGHDCDRDAHDCDAHDRGGRENAQRSLHVVQDLPPAEQLLAGTEYACPPSRPPSA